MSNAKKEAVQQLAAEIHAAGFRVFIAASGTYGFYTDAAGTRVVSFQYDLGGFKFFGNYRATSQSAARYIGQGWELAAAPFKHMFDQTPPRWATKGHGYALKTLEEHQREYQSSSKFTEFHA